MQQMYCYGGGVDNGETCMVVQGVFRKSLHVPLSFSVNLKPPKKLNKITVNCLECDDSITQKYKNTVTISLQTEE